MEVISELRNKRIPNFDKNPAKEMESYLNLFLELDLCEKGEGYLDSYEKLRVGFYEVSESKEKIITDMVNDVPYMRKYLILHSVFDIEISKDDWLQKLMINLLRPTSKDMEWFYRTPKVPKEILDKLSILDPEPVRWWLDPIVIKYKMWGKPSEGESYEPINIIDLDWEEFKVKKSTSKTIKDFGVIAF